MTNFNRKKYTPTALVLAALTVITASIWIVGIAGADSESGADANGLPGDPQMQERLLDEQHRLYMESYEALAAEPSTFRLPPDQAALWLEAWSRMRECALDQGFDGVPEALPTVGDGRTPVPVVDAARPNAAEVLSECPFVPTGMDLDALAAATRASQPEVPLGNELKPGDAGYVERPGDPGYVGP